MRQGVDSLRQTVAIAAVVCVLIECGYGVVVALLAAIGTANVHYSTLVPVVSVAARCSTHAAVVVRVKYVEAEIAVAPSTPTPVDVEASVVAITITYEGVTATPVDVGITFYQYWSSIV